MLPFFEKYPYTNFEQLNLDWLMETSGKFDARLTAVESAVSQLNTRMTDAESDITSLKGRMTTAEDNISSLFGRMTTAESDITSLKGRMSDAEDDITSLKQRMNTAESDITGLDTRLTAAESNININRGNISALSTRVDGIPVVTANPGGTGTALNSLQIGSNVYTVSGGGGGGSSVTPNPAGTPTDDLNSIDIDGTIYAIAGGGTTVVANPGGVDNPDLTSVSIGGTAYDIPITDVTEIENDITSLDGRLDTAEDDIDALEALTGFLSSGIVDGPSQVGVSVGNSSVGNNIDSDPYTLAAGTYLLIANCNLAIANSSSSASSARMHNSIIGLPTSARANVEGYTYLHGNGSIQQNIVSMFTLNASTSITLRTIIKEATFQSPNEGTLYNYTKIIKIR